MEKCPTQRGKHHSQWITFATCLALLVMSPSVLHAAGTVTVRWSATVPAASKGYGVSLEPFSLHVNLYDPPSTNPVLAGGNIYNRPQREVALSLGGREVFNRLSVAPLRANDKPIELKLAVTNVVGGADVDFSADGKDIYSHQFIPMLHVDEKVGPAFEGDAVVADVGRTTAGRFSPPPLPTHVDGIVKELNDKDHHTLEQWVDFPAKVDEVGRVICTLTLDQTPAGIDPWDRLARVYVLDDAGEKIELLRYITPYHKAWQWTSDVTDLLPVLHGRRKLLLHCETYAQGWLVSVAFDFFEGPLAPRPFAVLPVWDQTVILGQAKFPIDSQLRPKLIDPHGATLVKLRTLVTGHGMAPNTGNAGEFMRSWRKLWVDGKAYQNVLWKTDNYLNPCSPQHGTWKYDRAGWGPGTVVQPWTVEVVPTDRLLRVRYQMQPYVNETPKDGFPAQQCVDVLAIECK